ncbi:MAG TPA: hypothetical protein VLQ45_32475 [Thermoanaerobaculia bacterium]|nr:hypothetical protein [Thermoanaerobaculia bacterium]
MSKRSFAVVLLFVLGCGGSLLAGIAIAGGFGAGFLDESLYYEDNGEKITFTQTGAEDGYWFVVDGKVTHPSESPTVALENLKSVKIYKITPVSFWELGNGFRPCRPDFYDCPLPYKPLPPPPPTIMPGEEEVRREEYAFTGDWH